MPVMYDRSAALGCCDPPALPGGLGAALGGPSNGCPFPDDFMLYRFKIEPCAVAQPHTWRNCPFVHPGEPIRRRHPSRYYGDLCPAVKLAQICPDGPEKCCWAHNPFEAWLHPKKFKTTMCRRGAACTRSVCFFAHSPSEVRKPANALPPPAAAPAAGSAEPQQAALAPVGVPPAPAHGPQCELFAAPAALSAGPRWAGCPAASGAASGAASVASSMASSQGLYWPATGQPADDSPAASPLGRRTADSSFGQLAAPGGPEAPGCAPAAQAAAECAAPLAPGCWPPPASGPVAAALLAAGHQPAQLALVPAVAALGGAPAGTGPLPLVLSAPPQALLGGAAAVPAAAAAAAQARCGLELQQLRAPAPAIDHVDWSFGALGLGGLSLGLPALAPGSGVAPAAPLAAPLAPAQQLYGPCLAPPLAQQVDWAALSAGLFSSGLQARV